MTLGPGTSAYQDLSCTGKLLATKRGFHVGDDVMFFADIDGNLFEVNINLILC